jgi:hypothetical protein
MRNIQHKLIAIVFIILVFSCTSFSQDNLTFEIKCEVNKSYPSLYISKEKLNEARSLIDLNERYETSWVREYVSVEIFTILKGMTKKAESKNDILSQEQKDNMIMADAGTEISVKVRYLPENKLMQNDPKEMGFSFLVEPETDATFPGGQQQLNQYLKVNILDEIDDADFKQYQLMAVKFTINEEGHIVDAHLFGNEYQTTKNEKIEELLLKTICNMPNWKPAVYANGVKVKQEFVLTLGDMKSCIVPLLNIREN